MRCPRLLPALILLLIFPSLYAFSQEESASDISVDLNYRILHPGEVIWITLSSIREIKQAHVRFLGEKHDIQEQGETGTLMALIGIDLGQRPGIELMEFSVLFSDGTYGSLQKEVNILPKEFPEKRLRVDPKFVFPPEEELERIQREAELLRSVFKIYSLEWRGTGPFIVPAEGEGFPNFGERRYFNNEARSPHSGVDIASPLGAPVKASNSGKVVLTANLYFAGKTVIMDHGLGVFSFYCHLSRIRVPRGSLVQKGEIIGEVGATGRATGPHLHWSIRITGARVDPFSLLSLGI